MAKLTWICAALLALWVTERAAALEPVQSFTQEAGCQWSRKNTGSAYECGNADVTKCKCKEGKCTIVTTTVPPNPGNPRDTGSVINLCKCAERPDARRLLLRKVLDVEDNVCPITTVVDDPVFHLWGPYGDATFMFQGMPDQSFCLISDRFLQVNAHFTRGWVRKTASGVEGELEEGTYMDAITVVAVPPGFSEQRVAEVYFPDTTQPSLAARVDGLPVSAEELAVKERGTSPGPLIVRSVIRTGDLPIVEVSVAGAARILVKARKNKYSEGYYLDFEIIELGTVTPAIHGVLGQAFRLEKMVKARRGELNLQSDDLQGAGIVDGNPSDYVVSSAVATDCAFNQYNPFEDLLLMSVGRKLFNSHSGSVRTVSCAQGALGLRCTV